jgi:transcriptional regulator with XRE-family HTH domain
MDAQELVVSIRKLGLSQEQVAQRVGMTQGAISHIETGRRKDVRATTKDNLVALHAELLGATEAA